jgi:hypothetical protein
MLCIIASQRHVIAFNQKLDRITQGGNALNQYRLATDKTHLHKTPSSASMTSNAEDFSPLSGRYVA